MFELTFATVDGIDFQLCKNHDTGTTTVRCRVLSQIGSNLYAKRKYGMQTAELVDGAFLSDIATAIKRKALPDDAIYA